jgi:hypothetical protein
MRSTPDSNGLLEIETDLIATTGPHLELTRHEILENG